MWYPVLGKILGFFPIERHSQNGTQFPDLYAKWKNLDFLSEGPRMRVPSGELNCPPCIHVRPFICQLLQYLSHQKLMLINWLPMDTRQNQSPRTPKQRLFLHVVHRSAKQRFGNSTYKRSSGLDRESCLNMVWHFSMLELHQIKKLLFVWK